MRQVLIILTGAPEAPVDALITAEKNLAQHQVELVDLRDQPDYGHLLEKIFQADSIQVF